MEQLVIAMKPARLLFAAGMLVAGQEVAFCATPSQNADAQWPAFEQVDKNRNGYIEQSESSVVPALDFGSADKNSDRRLNSAEYEAAKRSAPARGGESDIPVGGTTSSGSTNDPGSANSKGK